MENLHEFQLNGAFPSIYYIPNFISEDEERDLVAKVYAAPKPKWTCLNNRRLQDYGGVPHEKGMIPEKIPNWLTNLMNRIDEYNLFAGRKANQVLINEYLPGQGIMAHTDGPLFFPTVTTVSCGSHTILNFHENDVGRRKLCEILLERRSLVVIQDEMYEKYLHSIEERTCDILNESCINLQKCGGNYSLGQALLRETRISITIRNVPKILNIKLFK